MFTEDFKKGEDYWQLTKCIAINIVNESFKLTDKMHSIYKIMETAEHTPLDEVLEIHFLDLTKIPRKTQSELDRWLLFIKTDQQETRDMLSQTSTELEKANTQVKEFYSIDEQRALYLAARYAESDRASLLGAARRKERRDEKIETAQRMKQKNFSSTVISEITGLSIQEIEKITV